MSNRTAPLAMVVARLKRGCAAVLLSIALAGGHPPGAQAAPIVSAPFVTVEVGDLVTIPISITDAVDLTLWQFDVVFDPAIVQAGAALPSGHPFDLSGLSGQFLQLWSSTRSADSPTLAYTLHLTGKAIQTGSGFPLDSWCVRGQGGQ